MANIKISALPQGGAVRGDEQLAAVQAGSTVAMTAAQLVGKLRNKGYRIVGTKSGVPGGYFAYAPFGAVATQASGITFRSEHATGPTGGFSNPRIVYGGAYNISGTGETANPTTMTERASLEYGGALTEALFDGAGSFVTVPALAAMRASDVMTGVVVPPNAAFQVRNYVSLAADERLTLSGMKAIVSGPDGSNVVEFPLSDGADLTLSGTASAFGVKNGAMKYPHLLVGIPLDPLGHRAVLIVGDSIGAGSQGSADPVPDNRNHYGFIAQQLGDTVAWATAAKGGLQFSDVLLSRGETEYMASFATSVICQLGFNDIYNGVPSLTVLQALAIAVWTLLDACGPVVFQTTLTPQTISSDGWQGGTAGQQISSAGANAIRVAFNDWLRDGAPLANGRAVAAGSAGATRMAGIGHPLQGMFEVADQVEADAGNMLSRNGGYLYAPAGVPITVDGTHYLSLGNALLRSGIKLEKLR